jgi:hypothetical protein
MLSDPLKFFDSLVRGVVFALYDFVMLSIASVAAPFVRKTVRFWPSVLTITKRLSALTLLLVWLAFFVSLSLTNDLSYAARFVSRYDAGSKSVQIIFIALLSTAIIDIAIRAASLPIRNRQRRLIARELWTLSIAGVFFFGSMLMLWPKQFFISRALIFVISHWSIPDGVWLLFFPGLSAGLVVVWGFRFRGTKLRLAAVTALALTLPALSLSVVTGSLFLFVADVSPLVDSREPTKLVQSNTHCAAILTPNQTPQTLKVITFLALDGGSDKTAVLPTDRLMVKEIGEDVLPIGYFVDSGLEIVVSNGSFVRFELVADFRPDYSKTPNIANGAQFKCRLGWNFSLWSSDVIEDRTVEFWR